MKITGALFLATLFCVTWEKVHWELAGSVGIADVLTILFLGAFALEWGRPRFPRTTVTVLAIFAALLLIYLVGFFNIETKQSLDQWGKGMVKFVLHFLFLGAGVAYLVRRSLDFYWQAVAALTLGLVANSAYGVLQLLAARAGANLDRTVLSPLTGGASSINIYGAVGGTSNARDASARRYGTASTSSPAAIPSRPLRERVAISTTSRNASSTASGSRSRWPRSRRRYSGVRTSSGTSSMIARWFGSPVSAFVRYTFAPPTAP